MAEKKVMTGVRLPKAINDKLKIYCINNNTTAQELFTKYVESLVKEKKDG